MSPQTQCLGYSLAHYLASLYARFNLGNAIQGDALEKKLREFRSILWKDFFIFDKSKNTIDLRTADHISAYCSLLGGKAEGDLKGIIDHIKNDEKKYKQFLYSFSCNYSTYLTYIFLKSQGVRIDLITTKRRNVNFASDDQWRKFGNQWGFVKPTMKRENHYCNIVWLDADRFVLVDSANEYVSPSYSWKEDMVHVGKNHIFKANNIYIKEFVLSTPEDSKAGLYQIFAGLFDGNLKSSYYLKALYLNNNSANVTAGMAEALYSQGSLKEAAELAQRALILEPDNSGVHLILGAIYFDQKDFNKAKESYQRAVELDPDQGVGYHQLAGVYFNAFGDKLMAKKYLQKAHSVYKQNGDNDDAQEIKDLLDKM